MAIKKDKNAPAANKASKASKPQKEQKQKPEKRGLRYLGGLLLAKMVKGGAQNLRNNADEVNKLNVFPVPDGDTGDNMSMTIDSGANALDDVDSDNISDVIDKLSHGMLLGARGNSGVILSQFFAGMAKGLRKTKNANPRILGKALEEGVKQAYATVMTPTEGTILTVARESVEYAVARLTDESSIADFFGDLVGQMNKSLEHTPDLLPQLKEAGVVDSGGAGLYYIMDGFNRVLQGEDIPKTAAQPAPAPTGVNTVDAASFGPDSEMKYGYCTELLVQLMNYKCRPDEFDIEALRSFLSTLGDSIVAFAAGSVVKIHVHTMTPDAVLTHMRKYGEFIAVKIENMSLQHSSLDSDKAVEKPAENIPAEQNDISDNAPRKRYGIVSVASGEGIANIMRELGADEIVRGGQTNNPSAGDFIDAYKKINAEVIFVFPNNSNILLAANMSSEMYEDAKICVIPSKTIGGGYAALSTLDLECDDPEMILQNAVETMENVRSGYISPAIRDADMGGVHIKDGDTIGIIGKEIVVSAEDRTAATCSLADIILEDKYLLTVFLGKDSAEDEKTALEAHLTSAHPDVEYYFLEGGQEIYPYVFLAE